LSEAAALNPNGPILNPFIAHPAKRHERRPIIESASFQQDHVFQVVAGNGVRGWLDGSSEHHNWLKLIRSAETKSSANMRYYLQGGQVSADTFSLHT
jgi:hypothetical protein